MVANILTAGPLLARGMGSIGHKSTFSEHGHVAYQIKGNHECSNLVSNILLTDKVNLGVGEMGFMFHDL